MNRSTAKHNLTKNVQIFRIKVTRKITIFDEAKEANGGKMRNIRRRTCRYYRKRKEIPER
jgi:hypothetical protein